MILKNSRIFANMRSHGALLELIIIEIFFANMRSHSALLELITIKVFPPQVP